MYKGKLKTYMLKINKICKWLFIITFLLLNDGSASLLYSYSGAVHTSPNIDAAGLCVNFYSCGKPFPAWNTFLFNAMPSGNEEGYGKNTITGVLKDAKNRRIVFPIVSDGKATSRQLADFLTGCNPMIAYDKSLEIAELYIEESKNEKINHDMAFCQMCLETGFLRFGGVVSGKQYNFCGLGTTGKCRGEVFPSARLGIRAHIQHLKAYSTKTLLNMPLVDKRFSKVKRGCAPTIHHLSGKWATDRRYGSKIASLMGRLYKKCNIHVHG